MDAPEHGPSWRLEDGGDGAWTLLFDRPGTSQNSLDSAGLLELEALLAGLVGSKPLNLRSAKPKGFCAGADLKELRNFSTREQVEAFANLGGRVLERLNHPSTVAIVHGTCLGGGLELALACSRRVVVSSGTIGLPEVKLGLLPGWGATRRLPGLIGLDGTLDLLLTGRTMDQHEALGLGLVDAVAEPDKLQETLARLRDPSWRRAEQSLPDDWREIVHASRASIPNDPFRPARERVLDVVVAELSDGEDAAPRGLAELVFSPTGRASLDAFVARHSPH